MDRHKTRRRLVVPLVLAVSVVGAVAAMSSGVSGCTENKPTVDAGRDAPDDTPIV